MATVTGLTKARMLAIEAESVVGGLIDGDGHLILTRHDDSTIDAGSVIGPQGEPGPPVSPGSIDYESLAPGQRWEPGDFKWSMQEDDHAGWLKMDGRNDFARVGSAYSALFDIVGTSLGAGINSDTFGIGNVSKRVIMGEAASGVGSTLGGTGGSADSVVVTHNHTQDAHDHAQDSHNHAQDAHDHGVTDPHHAHGLAPEMAATVASSIGLVPTGANQAAFTDVFPTDSAATGIDIDPATATNQAATANNQVSTATNQDAGSSGTNANLPLFLVMNGFIHV